MDDRKQEIYKKGGFELCQFIEKGMARTHGIGAKIVPSGQHQIIKKYKGNLRQVSFAISVYQKRKEGIVKSNK